jgi:hypothetical protein
MILTHSPIYLPQFSVSQHQGLITCLPKEGKEKHFMKNWRPITLLCVDFKLATSCIAIYKIQL